MCRPSPWAPSCHSPCGLEADTKDRRQGAGTAVRVCRSLTDDSQAPACCCCPVTQKESISNPQPNGASGGLSTQESWSWGGKREPKEGPLAVEKGRCMHACTHQCLSVCLLPLSLWPHCSSSLNSFPPPLQGADYSSGNNFLLASRKFSCDPRDRDTDSTFTCVQVPEKHTFS